MTRGYARIELIHQRCGRLVVDIPQSCNHPTSARVQEGPGEPDEPLSRIRVLAGTPAGGDRDQLGTKGLVRNVAGIQLERVLRTGQDDCGIEWALEVGGRVGREVEEGK